jgi:hypothetical protein
MIIKFEPNIPVHLVLTRSTGKDALSNFGEMQYQWNARDLEGNTIVFYATAALNQKIVAALDQNRIAVGAPAEICKRVSSGNKTTWVVQAATTTAETNEAQNTQSLPSSAAPAKTAPPAKADPPRLEATDAGAITIRHIAALYTQSYLEVRNAMHSLNGAGLSDEHLRQATASVFIESARRQLRADAPRLRELMDKLNAPLKKAA